MWAVAPTCLRPVVQRDDLTWDNADLNKLYGAVVQRSNELRQGLLDENASQQSLMTASRGIQIAITELVDNGSTASPRRSRFGGHHPFCSLVDLVTNDNTLCSFKQLLQSGKTVDFSGTGIAVPCEGLLDHMRLPRAMARSLLQPMIDAAVQARAQASASPDPELVFEDIASAQSLLVVPDREASAMASLQLSIWDEHAIGLPIEVYEALQLAPGESVVVHLPLDPRAVDEVRNWRRQPSPIVEDEAPGWIERAMRGTPRAVLVDALLGGEVDEAHSELARLFLGRPPLATQH